GYLLAAGVLRALSEQHDDGGSRLLRLALGQTAHWLCNGLPEQSADGAAEAYDPEKHLGTTDSAMGRLRYALPPVSFAGGPADWSRPPGLLGADSPVWGVTAAATGGTR
ncbi:CoA transferase, partial [Streptomyces sp. NPDC002346]